jgi:hypothetical protein
VAGAGEGETVIVHDREPGDRGDEPIRFQHVQEQRQTMADALDQVLSLHQSIHGQAATEIHLGMDTARQYAEAFDIPMDDIPGSYWYGIPVDFDFSINGIKVE